MPTHFTYGSAVQPGPSALVAAVAAELPGSPGQAHRWVADWLARLTDPDTVLRAPDPDLSALPPQWAALVAGATRYRLRLLGTAEHRMPDWTHVPALPRLWFGSAPGYPVTPRRAGTAVNLAPPELSRLGVFVPAGALLPAHLRSGENTQTTTAPSHLIDPPQEKTTMDTATGTTGAPEHDPVWIDQSTGHLPQLDRDQILYALTRLGAHLDQAGYCANIQVVGGAAVALTLAGHRVTADVDAVVQDNPLAFERAAALTAGDLGLDPRWIGESVGQFLSRHPAGEQTLIALPGLNVYVASPEHLLALKVRAAAGRGSGADYGDLMMLVRHLGLTGPDGARRIADLTEQQFSDVYELRIGYDEYLDVAREVLMHCDIADGLDPTHRMTG